MIGTETIVRKQDDRRQEAGTVDGAAPFKPAPLIARRC